MKWKLVWLRPADDALIELWLLSPDRSKLSEAIDRLEDSLRRDPYQEGESRGENRRVVFSGPIAASILIDDFRRVAYLVEIWQTH